MKETCGTVLIVGAGPTGMTAALELSRFGIPVRIVDKLAQPADTSRAIGIQARTLELLEQRGLAKKLVLLGNPAQAASVYGGGKRIFRLSFEHIDSAYQCLLFVSQAETERILREALDAQGVRVERPVTLIAFAQSEADAGVTAVLRHADGALEQFECAYLIEAEGAHSTARTTLGLDFKGKSLVEDYALGDLFIDGDLVESDFHVFSSKYGFMGLFPMGGRRFRLIASNPLSRPSKDTQPSLEELQSIYDQRSPVAARFRDMSWSSWFRINSRMIEELRAGRVFFGGDSAHIHSPAGAQGMNTGIQDMINLGWKLAFVIRGEAKGSLLDTYTDDRVPVIKNVLTKTEGLTGAIGSENDLFRSVFNHLAPWIISNELIQLNSTERMAQLSLNYQESPLSENHDFSGHLRAGDRVSDLAVTVLNRAGSAEQQPHPSRLFSLMDPNRFTLFYINIGDAESVHKAISPSLAPFARLMSGCQIGPADGEEQAFIERFGKESGIVLVRPDGYVAVTCSLIALDHLQRYCTKWFVGAAVPEAQYASAAT